MVPVLNTWGARFVFAMYPSDCNRNISGQKVTVVFKFDDYPSYRWWCEKRGIEPISTAEFFE